MSSVRMLYYINAAVKNPKLELWSESTEIKADPPNEVMDSTKTHNFDPEMKVANKGIN